jgi:signal transduction histidine kinase
MEIAAAILVLISAALVAFLLKARIKLLKRIAELTQQCDKAQLEISQLRQAVSLRDREESDRFSRLEHDLRSSLSGIVGFSSLLKESLEKDSKPETLLLLKSTQAIQQSAAKTLSILEAAAASGRYTQHHGEKLAVEGKR